MTELVFDQQTTSLHQSARFTLVPWLARFFGNGPLLGDSPPLPVGDPSALTDETIKAIQEITNRAAWKFLARDCGWPKIDAVTPGNTEAHSIRRLWEDPASLPKLEFSTATPDLLIKLFNLTRKEDSRTKVTWPDCTKNNGDLLVHHLAYERLSSLPTGSALDIGPNDYWLKNPLNAWRAETSYRSLPLNHTSWSKLCAPDWAPFVPWIGDHFAKRWLNLLEGRDIEETLEQMETITFMIVDWALQAEKSGRLDLLGMLLDFMAMHRSNAPSILTRFEQEMAGLTHQARQDHASSWVNFLALVDPLEESARKCFAVHPVERSGAEKCFLARWEALSFSDVIKDLRDISKTLRPTFS